MELKMINNWTPKEKPYSCHTCAHEHAMWNHILFDDEAPYPCTKCITFVWNEDGTCKESFKTMDRVAH